MDHTGTNFIETKLLIDTGAVSEQFFIDNLGGGGL